MTINTIGTKTTETENLQAEHIAMLGVITAVFDGTKKPIERDEIDSDEFVGELDQFCGRVDWRGGYDRVLNELVRWGYLTRLKAPRPGYRPTAKTEAARDELNLPRWPWAARESTD